MNEKTLQKHGAPYGSRTRLFRLKIGAEANIFKAISHFFAPGTSMGIQWLSLAVGMLAAAASALADPIARDRVKVVDGDSIAVAGREWRLLGYDTPETVKAWCEAERRLGLIAKDRLAAMVAAGKDLELTGGDETDRHGRPLGTLLIDGRDTGETLIAERLARPYNGGIKKGWCSRDSRDDLVPGPEPASHATDAD